MLAERVWKRVIPRTPQQGRAIMKSQRAKQAEGKRPHTPMDTPREAAAAMSKSTRGAQPSFDDLYARIAARAYELYVERGYRDGGALEDWLDAEQEILSKMP